MPRKPDKRLCILDAAAEMFAARPFDEVRLEDLARQLGIGKGTIYLYFKSKEELYGALLYESVSRLVDRLSACAAKDYPSAWDTLHCVVREHVRWAHSAPHFYQMLGPGEQRSPVPGLREKRREMGRLLERIIRRGVRSGEFVDPRPDLTAQFIPGCIRAAMRHGPARLSAEGLTRQIMRVIGTGIREPDATGKKKAAR
jgi:AcrR family transcriptional regulator